MGDKIFHLGDKEIHNQRIVLLPVVFKIIILIFGVTILIVGLHSHFQSTWKKPIDDDFNNKVYQICGYVDSSVFGIPCPPITYERYYAAMVIICFILSFVGFFVSCFVDMGFGYYKWLDAAYHVVSCILLIIAGSLYIVSAVEIQKLIDSSQETNVHLKGEGIDFLTNEKLAAGSLTIIQAIIYGVNAILIAVLPHN